jgi:hypothetical protein
MLTLLFLSHFSLPPHLLLELCFGVTKFHLP